MINLLPPETKQSYRYARRNKRLAGWVTTLGIALIGLAGLAVGGSMYLDKTAKSYDSQVSVLETSLKQQKQSATEKQVKEISNNLKLAVEVLSKQVLYSQMLKQLATIIPNNAILSSLNISQTQGALDITAKTVDYTAATQLQVNLADPANKIFSKADIVNISCVSAVAGSTPAGQDSRYPCTVTVRALFAPNNPFLFTGGVKAAKP